jgi:uracil-DNA glycosylase family 4
LAKERDCVVKRRIKTLDGVDVTSPIDGDRLRLALQVKSASINEVFYTKFLKKCQAGQDIFPLNAPSMPLFPANSAFLNYVNALGDESSKLVVESVKGSDGKKRVEKRLEYSDLLHRQVQEALRNPDFNLPVEIGPHQYKVANFVLGHRWGDAQAEGPRPAKVMLIGKNPWSEEVNDRRSLDGEDGNLLRKLFHQAGIKDVTSFYVTYLCKFMPPDWKTTLKAVWIKDCLPLLHQELRIVQPRYILCLGADAHKALFNNATSLSDLEGRVESFEYNCAFSDRDGDSKRIEAKVMTVINPKQVLRDQSQQRQLEMGISRFSSLIRGVDLSSTEKIDHRVVDSHVSLLQILTEIEAAQKDNVVAVDAEWHGQHPVNTGSYMRTIQFAWAPKRAVGIKLHEPGGEPTEGFTSDDESSVNHRGILHCTINLLNTFFKGGKIEINGSEFTFKPKRVVGHFFNADLEWLLDYGIDIQAQFLVPLNDYVMDASKKATKRYKQYKEEGFKENDTVPAWYRTKFEGGADTGLMCHAIEETASYKLETLAMRYTTAPRYDKQLQTWRVEYCQSSGLDSGSLEGYGMCPDDILLPYGMYDADVTLRLFYKFAVLLDEDYDGNSCREAFWESQIATPAVLEIHRTGITVDKGRIDFLTEKFLKAKNKLEAKLRKKINWPDFNIRSVQHVKELLFGHQLNGRVDKETGKAVRIRPPDAISLNLMPLFDTSKPPKKWIDIVKQKKTKEHSPTTGKQALALMAQGDIPEKSRECC